MSGSTHLAAPNATLPLGPGKLTATADLNTYTVTAKLSLPDATGSFKELNAVPVTATAQLINDGPTIGTVNASTGAVATTSKITMRIVSLTVGGIPQLIGGLVRDRDPGHGAGVEPARLEHHQGRHPGGHLHDPAVHHCLLDTLLINLTLPGPGNTITLTVGKGHTGRLTRNRRPGMRSRSASKTRRG